MISIKTWAKSKSTYAAKRRFLLFEVFLIPVQELVRWNLMTDSWSLHMINASSVISWSLLAPNDIQCSYLGMFWLHFLCSGRKQRRPSSFSVGDSCALTHCQYDSLQLTEPRARLETLRLVDKICEEVAFYPCAALCSDTQYMLIHPFVSPLYFCQPIRGIYKSPLGQFFSLLVRGKK